MRQRATFPKNTKGNDYVVGDLHGCYNELMDALESVNFNVVTDRCFAVGDLIDRGKDSQKCLRLLEEEWFFSVLGNHEDLMLKSFIKSGGNMAMECWMSNGGWWISDISPEELVQLRHIVQDNMSYIINVETEKGLIGICHAEPTTTDWVSGVHNEYAMVWGREYITNTTGDLINEVVMTYHGHTPVAETVVVGNSTFIDTGCVFESGHLTIIKL